MSVTLRAATDDARLLRDLPLGRPRAQAAGHVTATSTVSARSRWALSDRFGGSPDTLEAVEVSADHVAVSGLTEAEQGRVGRRDAIGMLVDEELPISPVQRVVQDRPMQPDFDAPAFQHRAEERERVADLRCHSDADALVLAPFCDAIAIRIAERKPHLDAAGCLVRDYVEQPSVLGEEQRAISKDADLMLS